MEEIKKALANTYFLKECEIATIPNKIVKYQDGQILKQIYSNKPYIGLVVKGKVYVYAYTEDGKALIVSVLGCGKEFGFVSGSLEDKYKTILACKGETTIIWFSKEDIINKIMLKASLIKKFINYLEDKIAFLIKRIETLTSLNAKERILTFLNEFSDDNRVFIIDCSRDEMACMLGLSRATLFRELSNLKNDGILEIRNNKIYIND